MSDFDCEYCAEYGMHAPNCPLIEHPLDDPDGAECGECGSSLVLVCYHNVIGDHHTRRVCFDCWDHAESVA